MNMQKLKNEFMWGEPVAEFDKAKITRGQLWEICIRNFKEEYGRYGLNVPKVVEEITELISAISSLPSHIVSDSVQEDSIAHWKLSESWFSLLEEIVDVGFIIEISTIEIRQQYGKVLSRVPDPVFESMIRSYGIEGIINTLASIATDIMKAFFMMNSKKTESEGAELALKNYHRLYALNDYIKYRLHLSELDIYRVGYIKMVRLMRRYHIIEGEE